MSIWVTLEMTVRDGAYADLHTFLEEKLPAVRGFAGALSVSILFNEETNKLLILEEWKSQKHHQAYIAAIKENGVMEQLVSFMTSPPEVQYFERIMI
ncbi:putative quinol monooxygenase [Kiloniella sp. EL199]|uniref:putative quinol monooxygenase n=1 Tax=Kiloniella sp. EL199 TaxID=2107581 RepID=UPI000EA01D7B|nr:antibiotic biosynthesis monooxygenase [Kiloniella sp. EL199]